MRIKGLPGAINLGRRSHCSISRSTLSTPLLDHAQRPRLLPNHQTQAPRQTRTLTAASNMTARRVPMEPQRVDAPLTASATFLVLTLTDAPDAATRVRGVLGSLGSLAKNVASRDPGAAFACTAGIGAAAWDRLTRGAGGPRPRELHAFPEVRGATHTAPSTPGDVLFHIRAERRDLCFEFERQLLEQLGPAVAVADATVGFRYFDLRDLLGFVDGTANPVGQAVPAAVVVAAEDGDAAAAAGGSYVVVQKYLHDMAAWRALKTEAQEGILGRTKFDNVEFEDAGPAEQKAHKTLATIEDESGEYSILRDNMPFGNPAHGEFGTYFIGYSSRLWVIEKMMERMFIGDPPGLYDRLLDYSTPVTGSTFFAPSASFLASLGDDN